MTPIRVAVATRCLLQPLKKSIEWAAQTGADGLQLDARRELRPGELSQTGRRQLLRLLDEMGLRLASLCFPTQRPLIDSQRLEQRLQTLKSAMTLASQLNVRTVTVRLGRMPPDLESPVAAQLFGVLNDLARHGNHLGVTLALTPAGAAAPALSDLVAAVHEGPVGIDFDPAAFVTANQDVIGALRHLHAAVVHVRFRDAVRDVDGSALEVPVGRGEVPWDEFVAVLGEMDYRGWLTADRTQGDDPPGDVARAVQFFRRIGLP